MNATLPKLPVLALVSQQRSGTNVLRYMLRSGGEAYDLGEIFYGQLPGATNFWSSLARQTKTEDRLVCPHYWREAWEEYLQEQYRNFKHAPLIADIKIDYFRYVLTHRQASDFKPEWYFFFETSNFKFIYLQRDNTAAQVISRLRAETTGEWVTPIGNEVRARKTFRIEPALLKQRIDSINMSNRFGLSIIERYSPLRLTYERLFNPDGSFCVTELRKIGEFTGLDWTKFNASPLLRKLSGADYLDDVENRNELVSYFKGTDYEWMFHPPSGESAVEPPDPDATRPPTGLARWRLARRRQKGGSFV